MLTLQNGQNEYFVLSVGFAETGIPLVTILENDVPVCYRLPCEYSDWATTVVSMENIGENLFPVIDGNYYVDIS